LLNFLQLQPLEKFHNPEHQCFQEGNYKVTITVVNVVGYLCGATGF